MDKDKKNKLPLVTVVTVVYNSKDFLEETIRSVIEQNYPCKEFVIIDGNSTDGTVDVIRKYERYIDFWCSEPDKGIYDAMNKGIKHSSKEGYITFLNAGDTYCNDSVLSDLFSDIGDKYDVVYGDTLVFDDDKTIYTYQEARDFTFENLLRAYSATVCHQSIFVNKRVCPDYDSSLIYKGELNWFFDIIKGTSGLKYLHKKMPVSYYRTGGFGDKHYWKNNLEEIGVLHRQVGLSIFFKKHYLLHLVNLVLWRYDLKIFDLMLSIYRFFKRFFFSLFHPIKLHRILSLQLGGFLMQKRWLEHFKLSTKLFKKIDVKSCTYSFIDFILSRNLNGLNILEIDGLNMSLLFGNEFSAVNTVDTLFTDSETFAGVARNNSKLSESCKFESLEKFCNTNKQRYDLVVTDSYKSVLSTLLDYIGPEGIIVYNCGTDKAVYDELVEKGFKALEFWGLSPGKRENNLTLLIYGPKNILGI